MSFEVTLEQYAGPLHLLLDLIERKRLPITEVSLARVTDEYLSYVDAHEPPPEELADFLVVAARLMLIKSHEILPREELLEEGSVATLAAQLELYKLFVRAADILDARQQSPERSFVRAQADALKPEGFVFPEGLTALSLAGAFGSLLKHLAPFFRLQQAAVERIVTVKERLREIHDALLTRARLTFRDLIGQGRSKVDIVVSFLALLELVKQKTVRAVQSAHFGEIEVKRVE
ncbi:hypothetical protein FJZ23_02300 [Candidatus Parcubacteria bacterium]|nr:hypothetical protein [Candidatus Parcubacteria bacterium]